MQAVWLWSCWFSPPYKACQYWMLAPPVVVEMAMSALKASFVISRSSPPGSEADRNCSPCSTDQVRVDSYESGQGKSARQRPCRPTAMQSLQKGRRGPKFGDAASL